MGSRSARSDRTLSYLPTAKSPSTAARLGCGTPCGIPAWPVSPAERSCSGTRTLCGWRRRDSVGPAAGGPPLGAGRYIESAQLPGSTVITLHRLTTADSAHIDDGVLCAAPGARIVACLAHPRQDLTHNPLVAELLARGAAVWTQGTRSPTRNIALIHEQALLDLAAGPSPRHLRASGYTLNPE